MGKFPPHEIQKVGTESLISEFSNWILSSYFEISPEPLDQNSLLTQLWKASLNMQMLK